MRGELLLATVLCVNIITTTGVRYRGILHPPWNHGEPLPPDEWFTQRLDHFDNTNTNTWKQRYQTNDTWFSVRRNAPVFLMISGEYKASALWMVRGAWLDYARTYGALCFQLEHRFYGMSRPTEDISVENLRYLSSEQALADLAYFIQGMNEKYGLDRSNKWILFGGSYPGSMAAWARLKYPHLIHAAVSASSPLLAKVDFREFLEVVADSLNYYVDGCASAVNEASRKMLSLIKTENGANTIRDKFKLCNSVDPSNMDDIYAFFEELSDLFVSIVQYNKDNWLVRGPMSNITIEDICLIMTDTSTPDPVDRMSRLNSFMLKRKKKTCMNIQYSTGIENLRRTQWKYQANLGGRAWMYQLCSEFGFLVTSEKTTDLFGSTFPIDWLVKQCTDIFGAKFNRQLIEKSVNQTNDIYGGLHIDTTGVLFVHGSIDPWHSLGIIHSTNDQTPVIFIQGTAHCADMYPASENDPPQLTAARLEISQYIGNWLMEGIET